MAIIKNQLKSFQLSTIQTLNLRYFLISSHSNTLYLSNLSSLNQSPTNQQTKKQLIMFSQFLITVFYSNKSFQNPILGKLSCDVIKQSFYECKKHHAFKQKDLACSDLKYLMQQCYFSNKPEDVNNLIMNQLKQAYITNSFFSSRKSALTQKLFDNSWAIFYNKTNLKKYQKYMDTLEAQGLNKQQKTTQGLQK